MKAGVGAAVALGSISSILTVGVGGKGFLGPSRPKINGRGLRALTPCISGTT